VDAQVELPSRTLVAAARIKRREDQLRGTGGDPRAHLTKCIEVNGEISEHLLRTVADFFSFLCNKSVIKTLK